jgi:hypothetical protein
MDESGNLSIVRIPKTVGSEHNFFSMWLHLMRSEKRETKKLQNLLSLPVGVGQLILGYVSQQATFLHRKAISTYPGCESYLETLDDKCQTLNDLTILYQVLSSSASLPYIENSFDQIAIMWVKRNAVEHIVNLIVSLTFHSESATLGRFIVFFFVCNLFFHFVLLFST